MDALTTAPAKLLIGGLLTLTGGLVLVAATGSENGSTLVVGGLLLVISAIGVKVHDSEPYVE